MGNHFVVCNRILLVFNQKWVFFLYLCTVNWQLERELLLLTIYNCSEKTIPVYYNLDFVGSAIGYSNIALTELIVEVSKISNVVFFVFVFFSKEKFREFVNKPTG